MPPLFDMIVFKIATVSKEMHIPREGSTFHLLSHLEKSDWNDSL